MPTRQQILEAMHLAHFAALRYWRRAAVVFAAAAFIALVGTLLMPRHYYSEARLFVRFGRENQVDPTASGGQMVSLYESRESEINSLLEILRSRAILDRVVEELSPEFILYGRQVESRKSKVESQASATGPSTFDLRPTTHTKTHQLAIQRLGKMLSIGAPRKSNIIMVSCKANRPEVAQQIVAKLVAVYQEEHVRVHRSAGSYEFFEEQAEQSLTAWHKAAGELRELKNRLGIVTIDGRRGNLEAQVADISSKLLANQSDLKTSQAKIAALEALIAQLPATIVTQEVQGPNAAFDGMRQTLYALEAQKVDLAAKMQDAHPRLVAVRQQVDELRTILAGQPDQKTQATEALNPSRQGLEASLLAEKSSADSLLAREQSLVAAKEKLRGELTALNGHAATMDELQQRVALAEANHREYAQRLEQARINRTLDEERISSISLVQPASYSATPSGPRRMLVLALGLLASGMTAVGVIAASAWWSPLIATPQQLACLIDVPLTGVLPRPEMATAA
jgi:uncharacterized protein involved in exopolysaccharide biosynthesis